MRNAYLVCIFAVGALQSIGAAYAVPLDPSYGAQVALQVTEGLGAKLLASNTIGQISASDSLGSQDASATGGALFAIGLGPAINAQVNRSIAGGSGHALALIHDTLTFHIGGGGSADVVAHMSGHWSATGGAQVAYVLNLVSAIYMGQASSSLGPPFSTPEFTGVAIPGGVINGSYEGGGVWHVVDGLSYHISAQVSATAFGGGIAFIDDPLTFALPVGVTFTSASGSTYSSAIAAEVPEPASLFLLVAGFLGFAVRRKNCKALSV